MSIYRVMCKPCRGSGKILDENWSRRPNRPDYVECPDCSGIGIDPIPWAELFAELRPSPVVHDEDWK